MKVFRTYHIELMLMLILALSIGYFAYLAYGLAEGDSTTLTFSGAEAMSKATILVDFGPRLPGSTESIRATGWITDYLLNQLKPGWDVTVQLTNIKDGVQARNIIAMRGPRQGGAPVGILTTHFDGRLVADADPNPNNRTRPGVAANQSTSGVALLLELARTLDVEASRHTLCLAFFDAEENEGLAGWEGHLGSKFFWDKMSAPAQQDPDWSVTRCASPRFVIALDTVGATDLRLYPSSQANPQMQTSGLYTALQTTAQHLGYADIFQSTPTQLPTSSSDWFAAAGIPAVSLVDTAYPQRNTLEDTLHRINPITLEQVGRTLEEWLENGADF